ncbi:hypothetical protein [Streptomyces sp. NPDC051310]|uniref:hypothetical protein n=1 Tax=Streptomyces sp. NPDC051310 TaxID=3365649 RepID=UPI00378F9D2C
MADSAFEEPPVKVLAVLAVKPLRVEVLPVEALSAGVLPVGEGEPAFAEDLPAPGGSAGSGPGERRPSGGLLTERLPHPLSRARGRGASIGRRRRARRWRPAGERAGAAGRALEACTGTPSRRLIAPV